MDRRKRSTRLPVPWFLARYLLSSSVASSNFSPAQSRLPAPASSQHYLPHLDAVRGIACLLVHVAHLKAIRGLQWLNDSLGTIGVGLFFAMSGFLITRILIADKEGGRGLNAFYNRRAARIFPIYFLLLLVLWFAWPGKELGWAATFTFNLHYLTGVREYFHIDAGATPIPPVAHFWSLCVEEHFYWFWPALVWLLPARWYRWLPILCIAATPPLTFLLLRDLEARNFQPTSIEGLIWRMTPTQLVALSFGAILAVYERPLLARAIRLVRVRISILAVLGVFALTIGVGGWLILSTWVREATTRLVWEPTFLHLGCGGAFGLGMCCPWLKWVRGLNAVGRISYGLYLFHLPIYAFLGLAQTVSGLPWWRGAAALLATFLLAAASFCWIEAPILSWVRGSPQRLRLRVGKCSLSLGSVLALGLAFIVSWQVARWLRDHPGVPWELRYHAVTDDSGMTGYFWMGVYHDLAPNGFRRQTPFPVRTPGVPRVAVVGDSFTFGQCVEDDQVLATVAENIVRKRGIAVEVLNLGKCGSQAEDVLQTIRDSALPLECQVIVYAAAADDFLPSGENAAGHTLEEYRTDPAYADRFRATIRAMQANCTARGVILRVIPFTQDTNDPETIATVRFLQSLCNEEGVALIDIESFLRENTHRHFKFNQFDSHPDAECHRLYGEMIAQELLQLVTDGKVASGSDGREESSK
jgi:peptidoglycan/LPS O-acetylase OafA/YrhL